MCISTLLSVAKMKKKSAARLIQLQLRKKAYLPYETLQKTELNQRFATAIDRLPARQREVIRRAFFEEQTNNEIAIAMQARLNTIKTLRRRALERLRPFFLDYAESQ
jgi:RNA polymerase sigma factor (sigma-70 family)